MHLRRSRSSRQDSESRLTAELRETDAQIGRLVQWIAKGKLVEHLERQMAAAEARRDYLRRQLAQAQAVKPLA